MMVVVIEDFTVTGSRIQGSKSRGKNRICSGYAFRNGVGEW